MTKKSIEDRWKAEMDFSDLSRAELIKSDKTRYKNAISEGKRILKEKEDALKNMQKIVEKPVKNKQTVKPKGKK